MTDNLNQKTPLVDQLFDAARDSRPQPSDALMARIVADADREINAGHATVAPYSAHRRRSLMTALGDAIGGWPALAGLTTATLAGVWIGFASPYAISDLSDVIFSNETTYDLGDFMPDLNGIFVEG